MPTASKENISFIENYSDNAKQIYANNPQWLIDLRQEALTSFLKNGIPTTKNEEWKYTNVTAINEHSYKMDFSAAKFSDNTFDRYSAGDKIKIVIINGILSKELSTFDKLPAGVKVLSMTEALKSNAEEIKKVLTGNFNKHNTPFNSLNLATFTDGVFIQISPKTIAKDIIHIIHITNATKAIYSASRTIISSGKSSEATVLESHLSLNSANHYLNVSSANIFLDENAILHYVKAQHENAKAYHVSETTIDENRSAAYDGTTLITGSAVTRNNLHVALNGEGADAKLNGLYSLFADQLADNHTNVEHAVPNCTSNQLYKGILNGSSHGVFNGKIHVHSIAQKTNSYQLNKNLLLGKNCRIDTKPQLEIFADDVKCTHGATIGQLNEDEIFYLQTRCITKNEAMKMLARGFADDLINTVQNEEIREKLHILLEPSFSQF